MNLPMILDIVVICLLVATIIYAMQLSRRLTLLKADRNQLQELIKGLQKSTRQAEEAVGGLKAGAADAGRTLHQATERGELLKADLAFITERAESVADRLEALLKKERDAASAPSIVAPSILANAPPAPTPISVEPRPRRAEKAEPDAAAGHSRLATLLKHADAANAVPRPELVKETARNRVAAAPAPVEPSRPAIVPPADDFPAGDRGGNVQTRTERDLLRALEARR